MCSPARRTTDAWLPRIALAALALMASLPFVVPLHTTPIPSFRSEWLAAALGLVAGLALLGARRLPLPGAALLALALAGIAVAQEVSAMAPVPALANLFALYLVWAALLACSGRFLAEELGTARLVLVLAAAVLAGALFAALTAIAQPWLAPLGWPGYPPRGGGPLGQINHLTVYVWLGLASALHLRVTNRLPRAAFWAAVLVLTLAAVLAGQRSSFVYLAALIAVAAWRWRGDGRSRPDGLRLALGTSLVFIALQPLTAFLPRGDGIAPPPAMRVVAMSEGPSARLQLLALGYRGIAAAPLTGAGIGGYAGLAYAHADAMDPADNPGPAEHAHNVLVDIAVELGAPAAVLIAVAALAWLRRLPRRTPGIEAGWAAAVVGMVGLHGLIEYPLWYAYFLGLVAAVAGAFGGGRSLGTRLLPGVAAAAAVVVGSVTLTDLMRDYSRLEAAVALGAAPTKPLADAALLDIPSRSLLTPWVQTIACVSLDPLAVPVTDGMTVCRAAMAFAPTPESGVNTAVLLWREGNAEAASALVRQVDQTSGHDALHFLSRLAQRDPRLIALSTPIGAR